ncbi:hypothetical protein HDU76_002555 [Blyttiomyces sp. JEL0837]|nr:hypothetical protein HDU76_002555 [Blyttiomyces sp. JEL0837]
MASPSREALARILSNPLRLIPDMLSRSQPLPPREEAEQPIIASQPASSHTSESPSQRDGNVTANVASALRDQLWTAFSQKPKPRSGPEVEVEDFRCPICLQMLKEAYMTKCGHSFCFKCIATHLEYKRDCPTCQRCLTDQEIYPNYSLNKLIEKSGGSRSFHFPSGPSARLDPAADLDLDDINKMLSTLIERKQQVESKEREAQLEIVHIFLSRSKMEKEKALREIQLSLRYLDEDLCKVESDLSTLRGVPFDASQSALGVKVAPGSDLAPQGKNTGSMEPHSTRSKPIMESIVDSTKRKRSFDEMDGSSSMAEKATKLQRVEKVGSVSASEPVANPGISRLVKAQVGRLDPHFPDLQDLYFQSRREADGAEGRLGDFSRTLSRFSKVSGFRTLARIHYADKLLTGTSSIVSSIEFDKDDDHFATAGVTRKIKIFDYNSVVWDYREQGSNQRQSKKMGGSITKRRRRDTYSLQEEREVDTETEDEEGGDVASDYTLNADEEDCDDVPRYPVQEMGGRAKISCLSWNPYIKSHLAASDYEGIVTLWDTSVGMAICEFEEHEKRTWSVDFCKIDPVLLASGGDDTKLKVWSTTQKGAVASIESKANICSVKWNPEISHQLAFGSADHNVHYYDLRNPGKPLYILQGHRKAVSYVQFLSRHEMVSASTDCTLRLWDVSSSSVLGRTTDAGISRLASLLDSKHVLAHRSHAGIVPNLTGGVPTSAVPSRTPLSRLGQDSKNEMLKTESLRTYSGHVNEKNFVGLSVNSTGEFIACGSETNSVFAYYSKLSRPLIVHRFGNPLDAINGGEVPDEDPTHFVSSVCWKRNTPDILLAANNLRWKTRDFARASDFLVHPIFVHFLPFAQMTVIRAVNSGSFGILAKRAVYGIHVSAKVACFSSAVNKTVKTFANQGSIPRLPIPPLEQTVAKYLESCKPLLNEAEMTRTRQAVETFTNPDGLGPVLQQRLHELEKTAENSWLEDIWLNKAYLEWREPSLINVNWWCQFKDHPKGVIAPPPKGTVTDFQIERASGLISNLLNFKEMLDSESIPADYMKDKPLCMNQFKNQFGASRIPGEKADSLSLVYPAQASHIVVLCRDQIYNLDVVHADKSRVSIQEIARSLRAIDKDSLGKADQPPVGVLTAGHRDTCYNGFKHLLALDPVNKASFETVKSALFAVCLDDCATPTDIDFTHHQLFHNFNGHNRWFDKAIQLVVMPTGRAGVNGEHTPSDAVIPGRIMDFIVSNEPAQNPHEVSSKPLPPPTKLKWVVDSQVSKLIQEAEATAKALIEDTDSVLLQTKIYGGKYIKDSARASPDAYVQLALQLTWARMYENPTAVYESASTRLFKHGRTETGRSMTIDTWAFAKAFDKTSLSLDDKKKLFYKAIESQSNYMKEATFGRGIDRHLLGLRCMIKDGETEKATLFTDPAYVQSMYFKLSSSNMSPGDNFYGGFGPVVPEGYGVNYAIGKDNLKFSISGKKSCSETDIRKFRETLNKSLADMKSLF